MSRATSTRAAPAKRANAAPIARHIAGVELVGHESADVVGLEDRVEVGHAGRRYSAWRSS